MICKIDSRLFDQQSLEWRAEMYKIGIRQVCIHLSVVIFD